METQASILETSRLRLRKLTLADYPLLYEMFSDRKVMKFYPRLETEEQIRQYTERWLQKSIQRYARDGHGLWGVDLKENRAFVGQIGLMTQEVEGKSELEIGYLLKSEFWGMGLATEGASACRDYGFHQLKAKRLISLIQPANIPSIGVARRIGMRLERDVIWHDILHSVYSITAPV